MTPLQKSIIRRCRSRSATWRFTITGRLDLRQSAISLASPNRVGATTCTLAASVTMGRTAWGRGLMPEPIETLGVEGEAVSRGRVRMRPS